MSDLVMDPFEIAKELQWEIESIADPIDAAIRANEALATLNVMMDKRIDKGALIFIRALGAYSFRHWDEHDQQLRIEQFDPFGAKGSSGGMGFVQNLSPSLPIQTLFLAVRDVSLVERHSTTDPEDLPGIQVPRIAVPVLNLQSVEMVAA